MNSQSDQLPVNLKAQLPIGSVEHWPHNTEDLGSNLIHTWNFQAFITLKLK